MASTSLGVSVVITVLNEADNVDRLLDSLAAQTRIPDEIVVCDGGSSDGTLEVLRCRADRSATPLRVLSKPGSNISTGRNAAISAARGPVIACTDAGVSLVPGWLEAITEPIGVGARVVSGFFASDPQGPFETALGATTLPRATDIDPARFLPSSRSVAFRKSDWASVGGYPEWLDFGEDLVFDFGLLEAAGPAAFAPDAVARFRPRSSLGSFARQYYLYARGDGKADLWLWRHLIRYATYVLLVPSLLALTVAHSPAWLVALIAGAGHTLATPYGRLRGQWQCLSPWQRLLAAAWVPVIRITGDAAKMIGYPVGLAWRRRHRPPAWRPSQRAGRI
jgi:glycosyltransferase involved in cell wall biosynthesis